MGQRTKIRLLDYSSSELCDSIKVDISKARPTFRAREITKYISIVSIGVKANCYNDNYGLLKIDNDTLNLYFLSKGFFPKSFMSTKKDFIIEDGYRLKNKKEIPMTFCECYFEMTYKISGFSKLPKFIKINGQDIYEANDIYPTNSD
ncbi:MAG: hypothetical protein EBR30_21185 [Cytophagia bacterium]|nr:hypothetical protein [Cytophagia bacterium]NBW37482.1 hypothetical protein [Cytophagia bacterium]